jgi:phosphate/phosphite/phosphonate ABC transporter binding protein
MSVPPDETHLGRYKLVRLIGSGGMGEVHLAKAMGTGGFEKLVALKILKNAGEASSTHESSLQREAFIGVHLDHDNVVQILDYGESDGKRYVAMEYVRGFSLDHVLNHLHTGGGDPLKPAVVAHILRTMLGALEYVHGLNDLEGQPLDLIHGDVTPSNVMLSHDGRIKLTDFGIAGLATELRDKGVVAGKPRYLPPDVLGGAAQLQATDIFSAGVMLYEALTGAPVWKDLTPSQLRDSDQRTLPPLLTCRPDCPEPLAAVADQAVHPRFWERFPTAKEFRAALDVALPRHVDDTQHHREFVSDLFAQPGFVDGFGLLPSTASLGQIGKLSPHMTDQTDATVAPPPKPKPLRFGMSPALSSDVARRMGERLCRYLETQMGREFHTTVFGDYQTLADCLTRGEVDFAWTPPQTFVEIYQQGGGMLGIMQRFGQASFEAAVIVRKDSPLQTLEDLRGASAAWVDRHSTSGYLFTYAELLRRLNGPGLGRQHFHGSHRAVLEAVANGWADFGATFATRGPSNEILSAGWRDLLPERAEELRPLAFVGPIPGDNLSHSPQLTTTLAIELMEVLTRMHRTEEGLRLLDEALSAERLVYGKFDLYGEVVTALETLTHHEE